MFCQILGSGYLRGRRFIGSYHQLARLASMHLRTRNNASHLLVCISSYSMSNVKMKNFDVHSSLYESNNPVQLQEPTLRSLYPLSSLLTTVGSLRDQQICPILDIPASIPSMLHTPPLAKAKRRKSKSMQTPGYLSHTS